MNCWRKKKAYNAGIREAVKANETEMKTLSRKIATGMEERQVRCEIRYNTPHPGWKTVVRLDTGETVDAQEMSEAERQDLFINGLGKQTDEEGRHWFVFRDYREAPLQNRQEIDDPNDWMTLNGPAAAAELIDFQMPAEGCFRVLSDGEGNYCLQQQK